MQAVDPRLTPYVDVLPRYSALLRRLAVPPSTPPAPPTPPNLGGPGGAAPAEGPAEHCVGLETACVYLGIKLCESKGYLDQITPACRTLGRLHPDDPTYAPRWARLSAQVDSFVFAVYGALDTLAQVVIAAYAVQATEEVKFPALERILGGAAGDSGAHAHIRAHVAATCQSPWFHDLRRLRNLVNYRSVIPAARGAASLATTWPDPPSPAVADLRTLPAYCASAHHHVAETVELGIVALEESGVVAGTARPE